MNDCPFFHVRKRTLLAVAGSVWLTAGINVARLGILSYRQLSKLSGGQFLLSLLVFCLFGLMFFRMSQKHIRRIGAFPEATKPIWHFFDLKSYAIMAVMMGGGIWLRTSGLVAPVFIAEFYTGLGLALALAGLFFWRAFLSGKQPGAHLV